MERLIHDVGGQEIWVTEPYCMIMSKFLPALASQIIFKLFFMVLGSFVQMKYYVEAHSVKQIRNFSNQGKWWSRIRAQTGILSLQIKRSWNVHLDEPFKVLWVHFKCSKVTGLHHSIEGFWYKNTVCSAHIHSVREERISAQSAPFLVLLTSDGVRSQTWLRGCQTFMCPPTG